MDFHSLNIIEPILKAVAEEGYTTPTPIQQQAIPIVLKGTDLLGCAQTGTGKTAAFAIPILQLLSAEKAYGHKKKIRSLIVTPTRELAIQIGESFEAYGRHTGLNCTVIFGGVGQNPQVTALRNGVDILIATPGRLLDLMNQRHLTLRDIEIFVLDEADRMLDMGFINDIKKVLALLPKKRQNLLFSATFSDEIRKLAKALVNDPLEVSVSPANTTAERVEQLIYPVDKNRKAALVTKLITDNNWQQVLIFTKTKHMANKLSMHLDAAGIKAAPIHGNKSQNARTKALADFKSGSVRALVATDIAARGLDIDQLPQVVNFELPNVAEDYVHRIGRTGRAGAAGHAISLVCADEGKELFGIERLIKQAIPRQLMPGFEPVNAVAESKPNAKPYKPKKPKVAKTGHRDGQRAPQGRAPKQNTAN